MMRCLVTGGCGFIGSHLVDGLIEAGHQVAVLDDISTGDKSFLNPAASLIEGSITDANLVSSAAQGVDWLFHAAALPRIARSVDDPIGTHLVNVTGTLNVLQAARERGVARVINSSSSSVYGDQPSNPVNEDMAPNPKSPYALQKLAGELYASMFAGLFGLRIVSLRYFNVYGPRQPAEGDYALVIPRFLRLRDQGKPLTIYGNGSQTRGYTHVSDVTRANLLAARADLPPASHLVLNIGPGEETSVNDIAAITGGVVERIVPNPRAMFEEMRKSADYSKAKAAIGWEPLVPLEQGLRQLL